MAYDAGMLRAVLHEIRTHADGAKVEKVHQPSPDEVDILLHAGRETHRLCIQVGSRAPRLSFTRINKENPIVAPMFCMLLRKHLSGGRLIAVEQPDFERVACLRFATRDEMGFDSERIIMVEIMGKYSNLMLLDGDRRILGVLRPVDFTTSRVRQVLPGMTYELPPAQNKLDPLTVNRETLACLFREANGDMTLDKWLTATFRGIATSTAREMAYRMSGGIDTPLRDCGEDRLLDGFFKWISSFEKGEYQPHLLLNDEGTPADYLFFMPRDKTIADRLRPYDDFAALLDAYYGQKEQAERMKTRAADLIQLLSHAESRLLRKLDAQRSELAEAGTADVYRVQGDLITANIYKLARGATSLTAVSYESDPPVEMTVALDSRLTPAANAQRLYKKYSKAKRTAENLTREIGAGEEELVYLSSVRAFLERAETEADLAEIREELFRAGYGSRMKKYTPQKQHKTTYMTFRTKNGYTLLCGRNNLQNEHVTFKVAGKGDLWFHVKGMPGSHVILLCDGEEPPEEDYTQAAELAAYYSRARENQGALVAVDYTRVKQIKKPAGGRPGHVIYHTNYTAYVQPRLTVTQK